MDAATVTADVKQLTEAPALFAWDMPDFIEHRDHLPKQFQQGEPAEYVPGLRAQLRRQAAELASNTTKTTGNIRASAELRQAIANTTLQRYVLGLSLAAVVIALISCWRPDRA